MKIYVKQERLRYTKMCSLILRIVDKDENIMFRFFALIKIPHKKFNRAKFLLRNYKKLNFTLDIYDYREFNDFNTILENNNLINYIFDNCFLRFNTRNKDSKIIKEWKQKNIIK